MEEKIKKENANYILGLLYGIASGIKRVEIGDVVVACNCAINLIQQQEQEIYNLKENIEKMKCSINCDNFLRSGISFNNKSKEYTVICKVSTTCPCDRWRIKQ